MSGIDSVQQIVAAIRAEMATRVNATEPRHRPEEMRRKIKPTPDKAAPQQQRMGNLIGQRVKALDPDDPNRGKKAFRIFLESVLLTEFGDTLINDPAFYQMVDDVQRAMEEDPRIASAISKAVARLLGTSSTGSR
jgi:hypothetical protein